MKRDRTGGPAPPPDRFPLSGPQRDIWLDGQRFPEVPLYNIGGYLEIPGPVDPKRMEHAVDEVVARNDALRTVVRSDGDLPFQEVLAEVSTRAAFLDLTGLPDPTDSAHAWMRERVATPFEAGDEPPCEFTLIRVAPSHHFWLMRYHHLVTDGWSIALVARQVAAAYERLGATGDRPSAPEGAPRSYRDFVDDDLAYEGSARYGKGLEYWTRIFGDPPEPLFPDSGRGEASLRSRRGAVHVPAGHFDSLRGLGREEGGSVLHVLVAALYLYLARITGRRDLVLGLPIHNRRGRAAKESAGLFTKLVPVRLHFSPGARLREVVREVARQVRASYRHGRVPLGDVARALGAREGLVHATLSYITESFDVDFGDATVACVGLSSGFDSLGLNLQVGDYHAGRDVRFDLDVVPDRLGRGFQEGFLERFPRLLAQITEAPDRRLVEFGLVGPEERRSLLAAGEDTARDYPGDRTLPQLFRAQVAAAPEAIAVAHQGLDLSYGKLAGRVRGMAEHLRNRGVGPEVRVAILLERSPAYIEAMLAVLEAGGTYVPLDPTYPPDRLRYQLDDSGAAVLITRGSLAPPGALPEVLDLEAQDLGVPFPSPSSAIASDEPAPENAAYVIYTSGSTGRPKGVVVSHRAVVHLILGMRERVHSDRPDRPRVAWQASAAFDVSVDQILGTLLSGGCVVVADEETRREPARFLRLVEDQSVDVVDLAPSLLEALVEEAPPSRFPDTWILGGEVLPAPLVRRFSRWAPRSGWRLLDVYGPTECTVDALCGPVDPSREYGPRGIPLGRPLPATRAYILDEDLALLPRGATGELFLAGECVARGYHGRASLTAERFLPDPYSRDSGGRMYRTGDRARWNELGEIEFLGRVDDQVKIRGHRIELGEIEARLGEHPDVTQVAVVVHEDPTRGPMLAAYVTGGAEPAGLRAFLQERLPEVMVPAAFVTLEALPRTPAGKLDRRALPEPEVEAALDDDAPATPTEELLAGIWAEVLGHEQVARHADFFALGGHSLLATRVAARLRRVLGVDLSLRDLFSHRRLSDLAAHLDRLQRAQAEAPPPPGAPRPTPLPASFGQERLWLLDRLAGPNATYNMPAVLRIRGSLDRVALRAALEEVVRRHEVLRTRFPEVAERPVQEVLPDLPQFFHEADLADPGELEAVAHEEATRPFDLAAGPLLRARLLRLGGDERDHALLLTLHHAIADGATVDLLLKEWAQLYAAFADGYPSPLAPPPLQYADVTLWQRGADREALYARDLEYWRTQLAGAPPALELPTDRPRPANPSHRGATLAVSLDPPRTAALQRLAREQGVTLFMTLAAALSALLGRWSGQDEVCLGTPVDNRTHRDLEDVMGFLVNTLVLRTRLSDSPTVSELLSRVRDTALRAYAHQAAPFERVVDAVTSSRSLSHTPLFQVLLSLENQGEQPLQLGGLAVELLPLETDSAKFDLSLLLGLQGGGLRGSIEYATDLFDEATVQRLWDGLAQLLSQMTARPGARLRELDWLGPDQRDRLLLRGTQAATPGRPATLPELVAAQVATRPDAPAVACGAETLTYRELAAQAHRLAHRLRDLGVGPEIRVGILLGRGPALVVSMLAVLQAGGAYVPLDPAYPPERLRFQLEDCGAAVLVTDHPDVPAPAGTPVLDLVAEAEALAALPSHPPPPTATPDHAAYVIYTSGSTGRPKGVLVPHANAAHLLAACQAHLGYGPDEVWSFFHSAAFDFSVWEIWGALCSGGCVRVVSQEVTRDPPAFRRLLREAGVTLLSLTPSAFWQLVATEADDPEPLRSLRTVVFGGEALELERLKAWWERYPVDRPRLVNMYGITETTVHATHLPLAPGLAAGAGSPIGTALAGLRLYVVDADLELQPLGVPGELLVGGTGLARGYLDRPGLTAERFVPDALGGEPGARLYRSGDRVRRRLDGTLEYLGRIDQQVKLRGHRIELGEIQAALTTHPAIRQAVVVVRRDAGRGEYLAAYHLGEAGAADDASPLALRAFLQDRLPEVMVPASYVALDAFPLTPTGKLDRGALPAPALPPAIASPGPATETEELLAGIWSEVLGLGVGVGVERIGRDADFFALGGHSLLATRVAARLRAALHIEVPLRDLFTYPRLADLAQHLAGIEAAELGDGPRPAARRPDRLPLSYGQERLWLLDRLVGPTATYNMPAALRLRGPLDRGALAASFQEIVGRHEVLRTRFPEVDGRAIQEVLPEATAFYSEGEVADLEQLEAAAREEAARPFDLATGPLLRIRLLRVGGDDHDHALLVTMHHAISDGVSVQLVVRELSRIYAARSAGEPSRLPPPRLQYADLTLWQRSPEQEARYADDVAFWKDELAGAPALLDLPTDRPRPARPSHRGALLPVSLDRALTDRLRDLAQERGVTLFMTLAAALSALLGKWSGQDDVCLGMPVAGRTYRELEDVLGFLVNTLVLRTDLSGRPTTAELLQRVRDAALRAHAHQAAPFERVVEAVAPVRSLSHPPLFQVLLALQNQGEAELRLAGLEVEALSLDSEVAKFDLSFSLEEGGDGLHGSIEYATDLFDEATVRRLWDGMVHLLQAMVAQPGAPLGDLDWLGTSRRRELLSAAAPLRAFPRTSTLAELVAAQARATPQAPAIVDGGEVLTYAGLVARARRLARRLRQLGVGPEERVALLLDRSADLLVAELAVLEAGAAYVPIDRAYPEERIRFQLEDSQASALVTRGPSPVPRTTTPTIDLTEEAAALAAYSDEPLPRAATAANAAYVIYTSGSTGRPKGVVVNHRSVVNLAYWQRETFAIGPGSRMTQFSSVGFDASVAETWAYLLAGATLYPLPDELRTDLDALVDFFAEHDISHSWLPTGLFEVLCGEYAGRLPPRLTLQTAGEALVRYRSPGVPASNLYGPTEAAVCATWLPLAPTHAEGPAPIGVPIANTRAYVLDEELGLMPPGAPGELYLAGEGVARGYLGRPDLTSEAFLPDPFSPIPGDRMYRTGDRAMWNADGELEFLGRVDQQVKIRGHRIELGEIEAVLREAPGVHHGAVLAQEDPTRGKFLAAYVTGPVDLEALRSHLASRLPAAMAPAVLVPLAALPLSPSGKVDRQALPPAHLPADAHGEEPETPTERTLATVWAEVLGREVIGCDDGFFALGGDSILAMQVTSRARAAGLVMGVRDLFECPVLGDLAARLDRAAAPAPGPAARRAATLELPLLPIHRRFYAEVTAGEALPDGLRTFGQAVLLEVVEDLDGATLREAWQDLLAHHEALRLRLTAIGEDWVLRVPRATDAAPVDVVDLAHLDEDDAAAALASQGAEVQDSLDPVHGPLARLVHFPRGPGRPGRLLLAIHHLAVDGVSWRILLDDLAAAYAARLAGHPPELPPTTTPSDEFLATLRSWAQGEAGQAQVPWWQEVAATPPGVLPAASPDATPPVFEVHELESHETRDLTENAPAAYRAQFEDLLLTAVAGALRPRRGGGPLRIDLEGHGREALTTAMDLSRTVGWFTSLYPVRLDPGRGGDLGSQLRRVKEQLRAVPHRGVGYGALRYLVPGAADLAASEPAQVLVNYLGRFAEPTARGPLLGFAPEDPGRPRKRPPLHPLQVTASIVDQRLRLEVEAGAGVASRPEVQRFLDAVVTRLRDLREHCLQPGVGCATPSDFPLAALPAALLEDLGADLQDAYPLTPMQAGMLFHTLREPESEVYIEQLAIELLGDWDAEALRGAWQDLVAAHPILRTRFLREDRDAPVQLVEATVEVPWTVVDLEGYTDLEAAQRRVALLAQERARGFALDEAPLLRLHLLRHEAGRYELVWTHHHLLLDGWSLPLVVRDLWAAYRARREGRPPALPSPRPFRDYLGWLQAQDHGRSLAFWRQELAGLPDLPRLASPPPPDAGAAEPPRSVSASLPPETTRALAQRAGQLGVTTAQALQAAWAIVLGRYLGAVPEVVFGTTVAGRPSELSGAERMVGLFINTVPVRVPLDPTASIGDLLRGIREATLRRQGHEHTPLYAIQAELGRQAGDGLLESLVVFENYPLGDAEFDLPAGLRTGRIEAHERVNYPLLLGAVPGAGLQLTLTYDPARLAADLAPRMLPALVALLQRMAESLDADLAELAVLPNPTRRLLLEELQPPARAPAPLALLPTLFATRAAATPEATALAFEGTELSYADLAARARRLARRLRDLGVGPEVCVALLLGRSPEAIVAMLAVLEAGGAYLPLDASAPPERLQEMVEDSGALVLVTEGPMPPLEAPVILDLAREEEAIAALPSAPLPLRVRPEHAAYVIYTSGSTGRPKGVVVEHRNLATYLVGAGRELHPPSLPGRRVACLASLAFDVSVHQVFLPLVEGEVVVLASEEVRKDPARLATWLEEERIEVVGMTPTLLEAVLEARTSSGPLPLRTLIVGAEALPIDLLRRLQRGPLAPDCSLFNGYGPTEGTITATARRLDAGDPVRRLVPIGSPLPGTRAYVLDGDQALLPPGATGELYLAGDGVTRGYLGRPGLTSERFLPDPFSPTQGARMYRTGDRARWNAVGDLEFLGRGDGQVKLRGHRIELGEVEAALRDHPDVQQAVVVLRQDAARGDFLVAYTTGGGSPPALRAYLRDRLPAVMVPAAFVDLAALPLTATGKLDRRSLPEVPPGEGGADSTPASPTEELVAGVWAEVLGLEKVTRDADFFASGGHSLLATRVVARLRPILGVALPLRDLFTYPRLGDLAQHLDRQRRGDDEAPPVPVVDRPNQLPLSSGQERLWFLDKLEGGGATYNMPAALRLRGPLHADALRAALTEVVRRHEVLRTRFAEVDGRPVQDILSAVPDLLADVDAARPADLPELARAEAARPFDLAAGPLLRARLLRLGADDHALFVTFHHAVSDGISIELFIRELTQLYAAFVAGEPSPLPPPSLQYADVTLWQRSPAQRALREADLAYWTENLAGAPPLLQLPTDRPRPATPSHRGTTLPVSLTASLTAGLHRLARERGVTLFMTLTAALSALLGQWSRQDEVCIGTPVAGRTHRELEDVMGFLVNTLVLRTDLSGGPTTTELLSRVRSTALDAYAHQAAPFDQVVDAVAPARSLAHSPLFQVVLALQNQATEHLHLEGLDLEPLAPETGVSKFDLSFSLGESAGALSGVIEYATDLFDEATVRRLWDGLVQLLTEMVERPDAPLRDLDWLGTAPRRELLTVGRGQPLRFPRTETLSALVATQAKATPDAPAVVDGEAHLTYAELVARARRLARRLRSLGIGPEERVALLLERSASFVVAALAVLEAGGAYVPLDPAYPEERLRYQLEDSGATVLVGAGAASWVDPARVTVLDLPREEASLAALSSAPLPPTASADNAAYVIYTSGSTGRPKGVVVEHRAVVNLATWQREAFDIGPDSRMTQFASVGFDASVWETWAYLLAGATLYPVAEATRKDPEALAAFYASRRITHAWVPTVLFEALCASYADQLPAQLALQTAGEALVRFRDPGIPTTNNYGPTEATVCATWSPLRSDHVERPAPIGRPIANTRAYVLDADLGLSPPGATGELCLAGEGVARGYLGQPARTAEAFVPDPFSPAPGARMYRTGDQARWNVHGELEFLGRADAQVKIRGHRIELGEVEAVLREHPKVDKGVVTLQEDAERGPSLTAYVAGHVAPDELRGYLRERLPGAMVPAALVVLDDLPLTPSGKVDRRALLPAAPLQEGKGAPPATPTERTLAGVWKAVLGREVIGRHDQFFTIGGDSILAIQITSRARAAGLPVAVRDLFEFPVLSELASHLEGAEAPAPSPRGPRTYPVAVPLHPIVRHFLAGLTPGAPLPEGLRTFSQTVLFETKEDLDPAALAASWQAVVDHHEALRLRLTRPGEAWGTEVPVSKEPVPLEVVDLGELDDTEVAATLARRGAEVQEAHDPLAGPLVHAALFLRGRGHPGRLLISAHHLAVDGVTWGILLEDLATAYDAISAGQPAFLPPTTTPMDEYLTTLTSWASSSAGAGEGAHWRDVVQVPAGALPRRAPPSAEPVPASRALDPAETRALLRAPAAYRAQVRDLIITAVAGALGPREGAGPLRIDIEGHGHEDFLAGADLSRTAGWFTSLFPVALDPGSDAEPGRRLRRIKEQLRAVPKGGVGYGALRYLAPDEETRASLEPAVPAEVVVNYLGVLDGNTGRGPLLGYAQEPIGGPRHLPDLHPVQVTASIIEGRFRLGVDAGPGVAARGDVERFADAVISDLRALAAHCLEPGVGCATPSDFPLVRLPPALLERCGPNLEDAYPLTPMQAGMLFHTLEAPGSGAYVEQAAIELRGDLDVAALQGAWQDVVDRHPVLRTRFLWKGLSAPVQLVERAVELPWSEHDLSHLPPLEATRRRDERLAAERARGFDLAEAPLLRLGLLRRGADLHELLWTHHHLLLDGWSFPLVVRDLWEAYRSRREGAPWTPPSPRPFREYLGWLASQDEATSRAFWREELATLPDLPCLATPPTPEPGEAVAADAELSAETTASLDAWARARGATLAQVVQAAWAFVLGRFLGGAREVVFGATVAGRPADLVGAEEMVGLFINTVPVRVRVAPRDTGDDLLRSVREASLRRGGHEHVPLYLIQGDLDRGRGDELFESLVVFENYPLDEAALAPPGGLEPGRSQTHQRVNYPILLGAMPGTELGLRLTFDSARVPSDIGARLLPALVDVLHQLERAPGARLADLGGVPPPERDRLLSDFQPAPGRSAPPLYPELFQTQAAATPEAPAVSFTGSELRYRDLADQVRRLAVRLRARGVGPEVRVALLLDPCPEMIVAMLAVLEAGGAFVPLDPRAPQERLRFQLEDCRASLVVTRGQESPALAGRPVLDLAVVEPEPSAEDAPRPAPRPAPAPDSRMAAYVIYTSGSSGRPKGVVVTHGNLAAYATGAGRALHPEGPPGQRCAALASFAFDVSVHQVLVPLVAGDEVALAPAEVRADPAKLATWLETERVAVAGMTPTLLEATLDARASNEPLPLRSLLVGAEAVPPTLLGRAQREALSPECEVWNAYGPTEATITATGFPLGSEEPGSSLPIGGPLPGTRAYVLDRDQSLLPIGAVGELYLGGEGVARGYLDRPGLTAARFLPDPFSSTPGARMYRTGDRARWRAAGDLEFLGRTDDQVKLRGIRIELGEVEAALREQPGVTQAAVTLCQDPTRGAFLAAYTVGDASAPELQEALRARLPAVMVPAAYVALSEFPRTPNGKLDRRALPVPGGAGRGAHDYVPPSDLLEERLTGIWTDVLGVDRVGVTDDFFERGGHSLLAVRIVGAAKATGLDLELRDLFAAPTIRTLARKLRRADEAEAAACEDGIQLLRPGSSTGDPTFLFAGLATPAHTLWPLARRLPEGYPVYACVPRGSDGRGEPFAHLEQQVAAWLPAMRERLGPDRVPVLCGHSLGGHYALEAARLLQGEGAAARLVLLDSGPPRSSGEPAPAPLDDRSVRRRLVETAAHLAGRPLGRGEPLAGDAESLDDEDLHRLLVDAGHLPAASTPRDLRSLLDLYRRQAAYHYTPAPPTAPLPSLLVQASEPGLGEDALDAWARLLGVAPQIAEVQGHHAKLTAEPLARDTAAAMARYLAG